jgi:hypothetical protein
MRRSALASCLLAVAVAFFVSRLATPPAGRLVTQAELARHNASASVLWLSVCGRVYDVSQGRKHYSTGGGYAFFTGLDGTRAFVSGDFTDAGLVDDVTGLSEAELAGLDSWVSFYDADYAFVGLLAGGSFYDELGRPKEPARLVSAAAEHFAAAKAQEAAAERELPACSASWSSDEGGWVWCEGDGEVPRKLKRESSESVRCACVPLARLSGEPYEGCAEEERRCRTSPPSEPR